MPVVRHQAECEEPHLESRARLRQHINKRLVISRFVKNDIASIAAVHDVMNGAPLPVPDLSSHDHPRPDHVNTRAASISSADVSTKQRVAIVGGGVIGCAIAFELTRRGVEVSVWERRTIGGGATHASAGILAPYIEAHEGGPLFDLTVRGLATYDVFVRAVREVTSAPFEFRRNGTIEVAEDDVRARVLKSRSRGPVTRWLDAAELRTLEPSVNATAVGGVLCEEHGYVGVTGFVTALAEAASRQGCVFHNRGSVAAIRLDGRMCVLEFGPDRDEVTVDRVVLSTGTWARELDPLNELQERVRPIRGQLLQVRWPEQHIEHVLWGASCYIVPWLDGSILIGATSEDVGFDETATLGGIADLMTAASTLLPGIGVATFEAVRVGLRPATADHLPIIGASPLDPRVIYATGHFRNGVLLAPLTAQLVASLIVDGTSDPLLAATSITRYKNGA